MKTLLVIVSLTLFSACASTPPARYYWTRDGYSYSKEEGRPVWERHLAGCRMQLAHIPVGGAPPTPPDARKGSTSLGAFGDGLTDFGTALSNIAADQAMRENYIANCLRAQGWRKNPGVRPADAAPSPTTK